MPSDAGGPDYQDAILAARGRELQRGDIEFHVRASDWYRHGHHLERRFNSVILHVVWEDDSVETMREDGFVVPILALNGCVDIDLPAVRQPSLLSHPCCASMRMLSSEDLLRAVRAAAEARFAGRAERFSTDIETMGADQSAYSALLEAMGYASNREMFRALADAVPYGWIMSVPTGHRTGVLLDAAGLGSSGLVEPPCRLPDDSWRLSRIRPGNHPAGRITAVGTLLDRFSDGLASSWTSLVLSAERPSTISRALLVSIDGTPVLGKGRADELTVSVVLPFVAALEPRSSEPQSHFTDYPSPPHTRWTRTMLQLLSEAGHTVRVRRAPDHQGLHALYLTHCRYGRTAECPICGSFGAAEHCQQP